MSERFKDITLLVLIIVAMICFIFAVSANIKAGNYRNSFEKEMAFRLDMEEKVTKLRADKLGLAESLKDKELEIQKKGNLIENISQEISKNKADIQSLRDKVKGLQVELEKMNLLKEKLEDNLKEELAKQTQESK